MSYRRLWDRKLRPRFRLAGLPETVTGYACRRGAATQRRADGIALPDLAAVLGNTPAVTLAHYLRPAENAAQDAAKRLARLLGS